MHNVIQTGSKGNAVIYHKNILIDCGVPFSKLKPFMYDIQIVLLTHEHKDHINIDTIRKLTDERPTLRIGCGEFMLPFLEGIKNVDVYEAGGVYDYVSFIVSPIKLYHDVQNFGYRIIKGEHKTIHTTDTCHLEGISAKDYDLYAIEHNYDAETIHETITAIEAKGEFAYQKGAMNTHLSDQQAREFIYNNRKESSEVLRLHESSII